MAPVGVRGQSIWNRGLWIALSFLALSQVHAEELAGRILFVTGAARIVDASGHERTMVRGGEVRVGDRLLTMDGALGQIKLRDGSLLGLRPDSAVRVESYSPAHQNGDSAVLRLERGALRVINRDILVGAAQAALLVRTPTATIRLVNADGDAFVIEGSRGGSKQVDAGTYSRVIAGAGSLRTDQGNLWLELGAVGFSGDSASPPTSLAGLPEKLLAAIAAPGMGAP